MIETKKLLVIVDMQNDFVTGSLANEAAQKIVPGICDLINHWPGDIALTRDTHSPNYLSTMEGKNLPIEHCIKETAGWCVVDEIQKALRSKSYRYFDKHNFGTFEWLDSDMFYIASYDEIVLVGTCTDICVITNALILKTAFPETTIKVISKLCAGVTSESHECALKTMESCQIKVIDEYDGELNALSDDAFDDIYYKDLPF